MKSLIKLILLIFISCSPSNNKESNIEITNESLDERIDIFIEEHIRENKNNQRKLSISFDILDGDTIIGFNANSELNIEYYVGTINKKCCDIYFYKSNEENFEELFLIKWETKLKSQDTMDINKIPPRINDPYKEFYKLKDGKLIIWVNKMVIQET
ncbi:MAG: hypothetical protein ACE364_06990 [Chlorobiota bacterium]